MINLGSIFAKSPFKPFREHMEKVMDSVRPLPEFFEALHQADDGRLTALRQRVFDAENAADVIKNDIRNHLPNSLFMPIDRRDFLMVLHVQDSIADTAQDIVGLLDLRRMELPAEMWKPLMAFIEQNLEACELAREIASELDNLVETGFGRHQTEKLLDLIGDVVRLETQTDLYGMRLARDLFRLEDSMKPVDVMFWFKIIQDIGKLADYAEKSANHLRLMIAS